MNLGLRSLRLFVALPFRPIFQFSDFFDKQDNQQLKSMFHNKYKKDYLHFKLTDQWKKPLERKKQRQLKKEQIAKTKIPQPEQQQKLVVHNPAVGIEYPPKAQNIFAIIKVDGFQYKVLKDTTLILDTKQGHAINQTIVFDEVPLIGTTTYTLVGRPYVQTAKVEAVIEAISDSQKLIVFKKKRRKNYKRSFGSRVSLTQCRVTNIYHKIEDVVQQATKLQ